LNSSVKHTNIQVKKNEDTTNIRTSLNITILSIHKNDSITRKRNSSTSTLQWIKYNRYLNIELK